jgi:hypothetical protein
LVGPALPHDHPGRISSARKVDVGVKFLSVDREPTLLTNNVLS